MYFEIVWYRMFIDCSNIISYPCCENGAPQNVYEKPAGIHVAHGCLASCDTWTQTSAMYNFHYKDNKFLNCSPHHHINVELGQHVLSSMFLQTPSKRTDIKITSCFLYYQIYTILVDYTSALNTQKYFSSSHFVAMVKRPLSAENVVCLTKIAMARQKILGS